MKRTGILPPAFFLLAIVVMVALHYLLPAAKLIPRPYNYAGLCPLIVGLVLNVWADQLFKKAKTTVKPFETPSSLVTAGPYRFTRHPMYLGMVVSLAGVAGLLGTATPWLVAAAFFWIAARPFAKLEEKSMEETFGQAYRRYQQRVRRWL